MGSKNFLLMGGAVLAFHCPPASADQVTIYQKTLAGKQRIVVTRQEIPAPPPMPQEKAAEEQYVMEHPGFSFKIYLYQYSFKLISADGKRQTTLWMHEEGEPAPAPKTGVAIEGNRSIQVLDATVQGGALAVFVCACFALSGLGVGLAGLFPRFIYENPAHRASVWALILSFVFATGYLIVCGLIVGAAIVVVVRNAASMSVVIGIASVTFLAVSALTGLVPVLLAKRRLRDYEWE